MFQKQASPRTLCSPTDFLLHGTEKTPGSYFNPDLLEGLSREVNRLAECCVRQRACLRPRDVAPASENHT